MSETAITLADLEEWAASAQRDLTQLRLLGTEDLQRAYTAILVARMLVFSHEPPSGQSRDACVAGLNLRLEECLGNVYASAAQRGCDRRTLMAAARAELAAAADPEIDPAEFIRPGRWHRPTGPTWNRLGALAGNSPMATWPAPRGGGRGPDRDQ